MDAARGATGVWVDGRTMVGGCSSEPAIFADSSSSGDAGRSRRLTPDSAVDANDDTNNDTNNDATVVDQNGVADLPAPDVTRCQRGEIRCIDELTESRCDAGRWPSNHREWLKVQRMFRKAGNGYCEGVKADKSALDVASERAMTASMLLASDDRFEPAFCPWPRGIGLSASESASRRRNRLSADGGY
jgi:hypothetical protein